MEYTGFAPSQVVPDIDFATLDLLPCGIIVVDGQGTVFSSEGKGTTLVIYSPV